MKSARRAIEFSILLPLLLHGAYSNQLLAQGNNPPNVSFANISNNQLLSGKYTIEVSASDPDPFDSIAFVQILYLQGGIIQGEVGIDDKAPYQAEWDTTTVENGTYVLEAKASDFAGNNSTTSVNVQVENAPSSTPSVSPGSVAVIGLIIALGLLAMIIYRRRSRRHLNLPKAAAESQPV